MEIDAEKLIENSIRDGIREAVKAKLTAPYQNPLEPLVKAAIEKQTEPIQTLLADCINSCMGDEKFRDEIKAGVRHTLAKTLIARFGGELEKQVNTLKSDPATRARITLAIEEIVKSKAS